MTPKGMRSHSRGRCRFSRSDRPKRNGDVYYFGLGHPSSHTPPGPLFCSGSHGEDNGGPSPIRNLDYSGSPFGPGPYISRSMKSRGLGL